MAAYKNVRKGTDGFRRSRGSEDSTSGAYTKGIKGGKGGMIPMDRIDPVVNSHGYGHSKGQCDGPLRLSGDGRAHQVGKR